MENISKYIAFFGRFLYNKPFNVVNVETISTCNRTCSYCPNSNPNIRRKSHIMSSELFCKIVAELSEINYSGDFVPVFYGEPLLDSRIFSLLKYTNKMLPAAKIKIITNGDFLNYAVFNQLLDAGVQKITYSVHDPYPKTVIDDPRIEYINFTNHDSLFNRGGECYYSNR